MSPSRFATWTILLLPLSLFSATPAWAQAPSASTWARQSASMPASLCTAQVTQPTAAPTTTSTTSAYNAVCPPAPACASPYVPAFTQACAPSCAPTCAPAVTCSEKSTTCSGKCKSEHCCPKYVFTQEKMPCIKFCHVCSKPLAEPCTVADEVGYGYTPTCWRPMGPLDYTHCTCPPPAILAQEPAPRVRVTDPVPEPHTPERAPEDEAAPLPNRVGMVIPQRP